MPKISVVIPTYNREKLVVRAIKSVLSQTFKDFELILVDDGSTDNTRDVVNDFINADSRVKYLFVENSGGPARPRNLGVKESVGKYISFLDSDDEMLPSKLEKQLNFFEEKNNDNLAYVGCNVICVENEQKKTIDIGHSGDVLNDLLLDNFIWSGSNLLIKTKIIKEHQLYFDENLSYLDDWDMWLQISKLGYQFEYIEEPLLYYYEHTNSLTNLYSVSKIMIEQEYILTKYINLYRKYSILNDGYRHIGIRYCEANEARRGRKYFLKSIFVNPFDVKAVGLLFSSFFGKNFFNNILSLIFKNRSINKI